MEKIVQTDRYPGQCDADVRQCDTAEVQVSDTAKHRAGQHDQDYHVTENTDGQYNRHYDAVGGPHQGHYAVTNNVVLDGHVLDGGGVVVLATQLRSERESFVGGKFRIIRLSRGVTCGGGEEDSLFRIAFIYTSRL